SALWIEGYVMDVAAPPAPPPPPTPPAPVPVPPPAVVDPPQLNPTAPCGHVTLTSAPAESGFAVKLSGFVGKSDDLTSIRSAALKQPGVTSVDSSAVSVRPWPQCEALLTLNSALANAHGLALTKTPDK